jgi:hypothetical protein
MVSGVQADPTRNVVEGPAASTDKIAETANGVFEHTADSSCQLRLEGTATQLHHADLWLVLIRWPRQRMGYSRIPPMESWF